MNGTGLANLDEMVSRSYYSDSRKYFAEAVACYNAGAYRACVVSTWLTVVIDYFSKLRDLKVNFDNPEAKTELNKYGTIIKKMEGDKQADQVEDVDADGTKECTKRSRRPVHEMQDFENAILSCAKKLGLINHTDYERLNLLKRQRDKCAHPSINAEDELYVPTAEECRMHLRSVFESMLQYPAAQGRKAKERLLAAVKENDFPQEEAGAYKLYQADSAMLRPRGKMLEEMVETLTTSLINEEQDAAQDKKTAAALGAAKLMHPKEVNAAIERLLTRAGPTLEQVKLIKVLNFLRLLPSNWSLVPDVLRERLQRYIDTSDILTLAPYYPMMLQIDVLRVQAIQRLRTVPPNVTNSDFKALASLVKSDPRIEYVEAALSVIDKIRSRVEGFKTVVFTWNEMVRSLTIYFNDDHVKRFMEIADGNPQLSANIYLPTMLTDIKKAKDISDSEFDAMLEQYPNLRTSKPDQQEEEDASLREILCK